MQETRQLAQFVARTGFDDIPDDVVEYYKVLLLDNLACGLLGSIQPWSLMVADMVREDSCKAECTVFGQKWRTSASGATLVNGVMIGAFEADHADPVGVHPGGNAFPALIAMAERLHSSGKSFLTAMILGYEVIVRIGEAATRSVEDSRGFHTPSTNGPFGAAAAVGKLLGLDETGLANALGIAGSHCSGVIEFKWEGAMTKRLHLGRGGQMGLESAVLASKGFTGPTTIIEGKHGYLNVFAAKTRPERLLEDLGKVWFGKTLQFIKPFAVHGSQLSVIYSLNEFKAKQPLDTAKIRRIVVNGTHHMKNTHDDQEPKTMMGAQYSMPFTVATTLIKDINDPYIQTQETLWNPAIRALARKVETNEDHRFDKYDPHTDPRAEVTIETDGERFVIDVAGFKGQPHRPFDYDGICNKFRSYATPIIGEQSVARTIDIVREIETLKDTADLMRLMAA
jgi:2-methylcitrate dehydratase PrpD